MAHLAGCDSLRHFGIGQVTSGGVVEARPGQGAAAVIPDDHHVVLGGQVLCSPVDEVGQLLTTTHVDLALRGQHAADRCGVGVMDDHATAGVGPVAVAGIESTDPVKQHADVDPCAVECCLHLVHVFDGRTFQIVVAVDEDQNRPA